MQLSTDQSRIGAIGALRGIAAVMVCWFHYTSGQTPWVKASGRYGWLGVPIFFVISGFLIPYSLRQRSYNLGHFGTFIAKRSARLYPPYLASIVVAVLLPYMWIFVPRTHYHPPPFALGDLALHLFYLNDLVGRPWVNVVYWTLAVEFQWYLLLGLSFPLIASRKLWIQLSGLGIWLALFAAVRHERIVFHFVPMFLIGVFVFQYSARLMGFWRLIIFMAVDFAIMWHRHGQPVAYAALATGLIIAFWSFEHEMLNKLGDVSYSLYLLHLPVGLAILDVVSRLPYSGSYMVLVDIVALSGAITVSYYFFRWFELPSQRWSSQIGFGESRNKQEVLQPDPIAEQIGNEVLVNSPA